jgi:hypothetical protein
VNFFTGVRTRDAVPDLDQPVGRPLGGEFRQLLLAGEYLSLEVCLLAAQGRNAVLCVDVECCILLLLTAFAVMAFIARKPRRNKSILRILEKRI